MNYAAPINIVKPRLLMCAPDHFVVDYVINPWMASNVGRSDRARAAAQWEKLRDLLAGSAEVEFTPAERGVPDMVFTANAGLAISGKVVVSRFRSEERRPEEAYFRAWFEERGFAIAPWDEDVTFEGAGDALLDRRRKLIWCAHGFRSDARAGALLQEAFDIETQPLRLIDPRFYHLDTCFCPLSGGRLLYYPAAFDEASRKRIEAIVAPKLRIEVQEADAFRFACNAVELGGRVFMNDASADLRARLRAAGFEVVTTPVDEFLKAGGSVKCLTLRLEED